VKLLVQNQDEMIKQGRGLKRPSYYCLIHFYKRS